MKIKWDTGEMEVIEETLVPTMPITKFKKLCDLAEKSDCIYHTNAIEQIRKVINENIEQLKSSTKALSSTHDKYMDTIEQMPIKSEEKEKRLEKCRQKFFRDIKGLDNQYKKLQKKLAYLQKESKTNVARPINNIPSDDDLPF